MTAMRQDASTGELVEDKSVPAKPSEQPADVLQVKIWSPFRVYFNEEATSVSGANATGNFDILPRHHNFISLLKACELVVQSPTGERRVRISGGIMQVHNNLVTVFLEV